MNFATERRRFPDPRHTIEGGLLMVGGDLTVASLLEAYSFGIFPWPQEGVPLLWFSPEKRGVLEFDRLHIARSLARQIRQSPWRLTANQAFSQVIEQCSLAPRPDQKGTWITPKIKAAYVDFHQAGHAHSLECWEGEELIGGLYGVYVAGIFAGESMFHHRPNASKMCLWWLIEQLRAQGHAWMDIQMVTQHLRSWGGTYIARDEFLRRLEKAKENWRPLELKNRT